MPYNRQVLIKSSVFVRYEGFSPLGVKAPKACRPDEHGALETCLGSDNSADGLLTGVIDGSQGAVEILPSLGSM